jgi:hypothetical protein
MLAAAKQIGVGDPLYMAWKVWRAGRHEHAAARYRSGEQQAFDFQRDSNQHLAPEVVDLAGVPSPAHSLRRGATYSPEELTSQETTGGSCGLIIGSGHNR